MQDVLLFEVTLLIVGTALLVFVVSLVTRPDRFERSRWEWLIYMLVFGFGFLWLGDLIGDFLSTGQTASAVEWSVGIILLGLSLPLLTKLPRVLPTDENRFTDEYLGTLDRSANDAFVLGLTLQTTLLAAAAAGIVSSDALPNLILVLVVVQVLTYSASALARDRRAGKRRQAQAKEQSPS